MIRIQKILVPTDFREHSSLAAAYANEIADRFQAEVHLLKMLHEPLVPPPRSGRR